jgi:hypothetical protein
MFIYFQFIKVEIIYFSLVKKAMMKAEYQNTYQKYAKSVIFKEI